MHAKTYLKRNKKHELLTCCSANHDSASLDLTKFVTKTAIGDFWKEEKKNYRFYSKFDKYKKLTAIIVFY